MVNCIEARFYVVRFAFHDDLDVDVDEQKWILASMIPYGRFCAT